MLLRKWKQSNTLSKNWRQKIKHREWEDKKLSYGVATWLASREPLVGLRWVCEEERNRPKTTSHLCVFVYIHWFVNKKTEGWDSFTGETREKFNGRGSVLGDIVYLMFNIYRYEGKKVIMHNIFIMKMFRHITWHSCHLGNSDIFV